MKSFLLPIFLLVFVLQSSLQAQYSIGNFNKTFVDAARGNRNIPAEVYYPTDGNGNPAQGSFPVIVFGHGFVMVYSAYQNLWEQWVPKGYIMVFPTTEGALFPTPNHSNFAADLSYLVGAIQSENTNANSDLFGIVANSSALMGHSMGGGCSFLAAANNSSIKTVIGLAPAETNPSAISASPQITVPVLVLSGERDGVTPPADNHLPMYNDAGADCKVFVSVLGGAHCYFANSNFNCDFGETTSSTGISISRATQQQITYDYVTPWLDFYLKDDCDAFTRLSDSLAAANSPRVATQHSCTLNTIPDISLQNSIFSTSTVGTAYQWLADTIAVAGATQSTFTPTLSGVYSVQVTFDNGCSLSSDTLHYTAPVSGVSHTHEQQPFVYSHNGVLYWQNMPNDAVLTLVDWQGRVCWSQNISDNYGQMPIPAHLSGFLYVLHLRHSHFSGVWRLRL